MSEQNEAPDAALEAHAAAIDTIRKSSDELLGSALAPRQQHLVVDLINAAQDLNTAYWEKAIERPVCADSTALVGVLAEHQIITGNRGLTPRCTCGWLGQVFGNDFRKDFIAHQADVVQSALRPAP